jgi:phosphonate transport system permease protein
VPPPPPRRNPWHTLLFCLGLIVAMGVLAWAWHGAEMDPLKLLRNSENMAAMASGFLDVRFTYWRSYVSEMLSTVQIALWGSLIAVVAAVPLGLMAAANVSPTWLRFPVRRLLDCLRAINEIVFALIFIAAVGLGPFAGVLALAVHTTGILGKLFSEVVEAIDPRPVEGIRATGASHLEEVAYGVVPQVMPMWVSYALYRFESNVRSATVLGLVGAGGIGYTLNELSKSFDYGHLAALLIIVVATVMVLDMISGQLRRLLV